jgi:carboxypeptidase PM20D1
VDTTLIFSILIIVLVLLLFFAALLIFRATIYGKVPSLVAPSVQEELLVDGAVVAEHLASVLRLQTVSDLDRSKINLSTFEVFHATLERMYPRLHATLKREKINGYSLLYTWEGRASEQESIALLGHMDVVPADPATRNEWTHPPFAGVVADGFVWGRGALDMKSTVIAVMEAVEGLIKTGYQPERTLYLAFGHDEEIDGWQGANCIVEILGERGVHLAAVLDEGGCIMEGMLPGLELPVGLVGVTEKGHATVELSVEGRPGHSSMPAPHTAIGILARAIARLEANPMPPRLNLVKMMFSELGAFLPFFQRLAFANTWLLGGMLLKRLQGAATTNALVRTTMATTVIQGGIKENVLPAEARALVNGRMLPGDTSVDLLNHIRKSVNDEAVQITMVEKSTWEASPVSPVASSIYQSLSQTIRQVFPSVVVAPYLVAGATDSRRYTKLSPNVYRFSPTIMDADLLKTMHGIDERIPVEGLEKMVMFYGQIIKSWTTIIGAAE